MTGLQTYVAPRMDLRKAANVVRVVAGVVTAISVGAAIVSSLVLLRRFRPDLQREDIDALDVAVRHYAPRPWVRAHEVALNVAANGSVVWAALTVALVRARTRARTAAMLVATAGVTICCLAASFTWGLVRWDQIALWAVTSGEFFADGGLWKPASSDDVRFVLIDGAEVGQGTYRRALLVHLAAPVVAAIALVASVRLGRPTSTHAQVEPTSA